MIGFLARAGHSLGRLIASFGLGGSGAAPLPTPTFPPTARLRALRGPVGVLCPVFRCTAALVPVLDPMWGVLTEDYDSDFAFDLDPFRVIGPTDDPNL